MTSGIQLPRFQVLIDESYGTSEESSRVVTPRNEQQQTQTSVRGSFVGSVLNLSAAALGVGIVAIPYAFFQIGAIGGIACVVVFATLATVTLLWLLECSKLSKKMTFEGNVTFFLGEWGFRFFSINLVILLFGGCVAMYMVAVSTIRGIWNTPLIDVVGTLVIMGLSLVVMDDPVNRLKFTSLSTVACVAYICGLVLYQWWIISQSREDEKSACITGESSLGDLVSSSSIVLNSFIMNFIFFEIVSSVPRGSLHTVKQIVYVALGVIIVPIYILIGVAGLYGLENCGQVPSNIFGPTAVWTISPFVVDSGRVALAMLNFAKFPLLLLPLCHTLFPHNEEHARVHISLLIGCVVLVSYLFSDITQVLNLMGTTCGISIGFIIPAAMYYRLQDIENEQADLAERIMTYHQSLPETDPVTPSASRRAKKRSWKKSACFAIICASTLYAATGIYFELSVSSVETYLRVQ